MKKLFLILMLALLGMTQTVAQDYEYVPFVREGVKWVYYITNYHGGPSDYDPNPRTIYRTLEIKGDTVINGKSYKIMHKYDGDGFNLESEKDEIPIFLREEDKIVYGLVPEGTMYYDLQDCLIGDTRFIPFETVYSGAEFVLYDFNDPVAFWTSLVDNADDGHQYDHISMDTIVVGNHLAKRYVGEVIGEFEIIEGIGYSGHSSYPLGAFQGSGSGVMSAHTYFSHVIEDGKIIYKTDNYNDDSYLPLVREGVRWVNEKVIVNHGDTTSYYYSYEFSGTDTLVNLVGDINNACYYYTDSKLDTTRDSLIAGLRESYYRVTFFRNNAYGDVCRKGRNMLELPYYLDGGTYDLYWFYIYPDMDIVDFYLDVQDDTNTEEKLTEDNFIEVDPVEIEGVTCSRWAYLGEDGEPLAYVVEGIGFDSRDLGDLLTPFTRKPDPDADYQEWCGLCHVVKDGKVIYKGMRYTPDNMTGIDEVVADKGQRAYDGTYYNLMGQPVGKEVPTTPGIYIHNGNKIIVR